MSKLTIPQWAENDRPREKMMNKGIEALSDAELLAILIGSGNSEMSAVELMKLLLDLCGNNLNALAKWELHDLTQIKGLGPAKGISIMAALELGKRRNSQEALDRVQVRSSADIYNIFLPLLRDKPVEEFWLLLMNQAGRVISHLRISHGGIDQTAADIREILRHAILQHATQIAVVHNHPSGNPKPSKEDQNITQRLKEAAKLMNIRLTDHLVVCDDAYYSFCDEGTL